MQIPSSPGAVEGFNRISATRHLDVMPKEPVTVIIPYMIDPLNEVVNRAAEVSYKGWHRQSLPHRIDLINVSNIASDYDRHSSDMIASACDLALSRCHTEYIFYTHNDVFPLRPDVLSNLLATLKTAQDNNPETVGIGDQLSPRLWIPSDWPPFFSHACLLLDVYLCREIGLTWAMDGIYCYQEGVDIWPYRDTEISANLIVWKQGYDWINLGQEENNDYQTEYVYHIRSLQSHALYNPVGLSSKMGSGNILSKIEEFDALYEKWPLGGQGRIHA